MRSLSRRPLQASQEKSLRPGENLTVINTWGSPYPLGLGVKTTELAHEYIETPEICELHRLYSTLAQRYPLYFWRHKPDADGHWVCAPPIDVYFAQMLSLNPSRGWSNDLLANFDEEELVLVNLLPCHPINLKSEGCYPQLIPFSSLTALITNYSDKHVSLAHAGLSSVPSCWGHFLFNPGIFSTASPTDWDPCSQHGPPLPSPQLIGSLLPSLFSPRTGPSKGQSD